MDYLSNCWIFIFLLRIPCSKSSEELEMTVCTWPERNIIQLRCDYTNCRHLNIVRITASRLRGDLNLCNDLNANVSTRVTIESCNYILMEQDPYLREVRSNCTKKEECQFTPFNELFETLGGCGETGINMRNWMKIQYTCTGDAAGVPCQPLFTDTPTTRPQTTSKTEKPFSLETKTPRRTTLRTLATTKKNLETPAVRLIIGVLSTLLVLAIVLIIAAVLYRAKACHKDPDRYGSYDRGQHKRSVKIKDHELKRSFRIDAERLRELEERIQYTEENVGGQEFEPVAARSLPTRSKSVSSPQKPKANTSNRKSMKERQTTNGTNGTAVQSTSQQSLEHYYSDTDSVSTEDGEGKKRRRVKPLPPLPKPQIRHSEVYFTETETENESSRGKMRPFIPGQGANKPKTSHTNGVRSAGYGHSKQKNDLNNPFRSTVPEVEEDKSDLE